jgi:glycosyltransferase involved in cell wall biosynthesis
MAASLAEHRASRGDVVTVLAGRGGYVPSAVGSRAGEGEHPRVHRIWTPRLGRATYARRVLDYLSFYIGATARLLVLPGQDVIVSLTTPPYIALAGAAHKALHPGTRLLLWSMDCYPDAPERLGTIRPGGLLSRILRRLNRALFRRLDGLVCLDEAMRDLLLSQYPPADRPLPAVVIPNWERQALFPAAEPPSVPGDEFLVLYLGNAGAGHCFETVLEAAETLRSERVRFDFVGGGSQWRGLARLRDQRRLDKLVLRDYVPKERTPAVMAAAGCALITLRDEALGVMSPSKLHSSLAMGLPIAYVGPAGSNVDEAVGRFGCGVSLRHGEAKALADFIRRLAGDAQFRTQLRTRSRRAFEAAYCDARTLPQFDRVLDEVASGETVASSGRRRDDAERSDHEPTRPPSRGLDLQGDQVLVDRQEAAVGEPRPAIQEPASQEVHVGEAEGGTEGEAKG